MARGKRHTPEQIVSLLRQIEARSPRNVVVVAMANKLARIAWAVLTKGENYSTAACT
jgi:transposase